MIASTVHLHPQYSVMILHWLRTVKGIYFKSSPKHIYKIIDKVSVNLETLLCKFCINWRQIQLWQVSSKTLMTVEKIFFKAFNDSFFMSLLFGICNLTMLRKTDKNNESLVYSYFE